uniref:Uncharacterized protein n=2 Tax=Kalmanozyma brasiliensis (strain GHG001) TaxID=1365824 RepID=V5GS50_KALBG
MKADDIHLDDTFLATVVSGLSAPLRNPLAALTSVEHKKLTRKLVRSVFRRYAATATGKGRGSLPRALSALIAAEIDTLQVIPEHEAALRANSVDRIQTSIGQLDAASAPEAFPIAGTLDKQPLSESQLAGVCLRLRLHAALGDMDRAMAELRRLLSVEAVPGPNEATENHYELVLKQRGGVISLFSAAMQRREEHKGQDAGYEVLKAAISSRWFVRVWTGRALPSNPSLDLDPEDYEGEATILRLWKRWMHAWSIDYWTEGSKTGPRIDDGVPDALDGRPKYHTFAGSYPWQTLKRGLKLLNLTMDQYEAFYSGRPLLAPSRSSPRDDPDPTSVHLASIDYTLDTKPPRYIAQFACLFNERNMLDNIVYLCLHGGRTPKGETMATHVQRRLSLLLRTLTRVHVSARTWEHVEASMLRHLAEIPCEVLPTELVRPTMEAIEQRKRTALLRNRDLVRTLQDQSGAQDPPETGTIFVLRQMLKQRALQKAQSDTKPQAALTH